MSNTMDTSTASPKPTLPKEAPSSAKVPSGLKIGPATVPALTPPTPIAMAALKSRGDTSISRESKPRGKSILEGIKLRVSGGGYLSPSSSDSEDSEKEEKSDGEALYAESEESGDDDDDDDDNGEKEIRKRFSSRAIVNPSPTEKEDELPTLSTDLTKIRSALSALNGNKQKKKGPQQKAPERSVKPANRPDSQALPAHPLAIPPSPSKTAPAYEYTETGDGEGVFSTLETFLNEQPTESTKMQPPGKHKSNSPRRESALTAISSLVPPPPAPVSDMPSALNSTIVKERGSGAQAVRGNVKQMSEICNPDIGGSEPVNSEESENAIHVENGDSSSVAVKPRQKRVSKKALGLAGPNENSAKEKSIPGVEQVIEDTSKSKRSPRKSVTATKLLSDDESDGASYSSSCSCSDCEKRREKNVKDAEEESEDDIPQGKQRSRGSSGLDSNRSQRSKTKFDSDVVGKGLANRKTKKSSTEGDASSNEADDKLAGKSGESDTDSGMSEREIRDELQITGHQDDKRSRRREGKTISLDKASRQGTLAQEALHQTNSGSESESDDRESDSSTIGRSARAELEKGGASYSSSSEDEVANARVKKTSRTRSASSVASSEGSVSMEKTSLGQKQQKSQAAADLKTGLRRRSRRKGHSEGSNDEVTSEDDNLAEAESELDEPEVFEFLPQEKESTQPRKTRRGKLPKSSPVRSLEDVFEPAVHRTESSKVIMKRAGNAEVSVDEDVSEGDSNKRTKTSKKRKEKQSFTTRRSQADEDDGETSDTSGPLKPRLKRKERRVSTESDAMSLPKRKSKEMARLEMTRRSSTKNSGSECSASEESDKEAEETSSYSSGGRTRSSSSDSSLTSSSSSSADSSNTEKSSGRKKRAARTNKRAAVKPKKKTSPSATVEVNSSKGAPRYRGVSFRSKKRFLPWRASIAVDRKMKHLGYFATELEAAKRYDEAAKELLGVRATLNFPPEGEAVLPARKEKTSAFRGVHLSRGRYVASITNKGHQISLGHYEGEIAAALAYDKAAKSLWGDDADLNFPLGEASVPEELRSEEPRKKQKKTVVYRGVSRTAKGKFNARLTWHGKQESVGTFDDPKVAAIAWDAALRAKAAIVGEEIEHLLNFPDLDGAPELPEVQRRRKRSQFRGLSYSQNKTDWVVYVTVNGEREYIGAFEDEVIAARAYDQAAVRLLGKRKARLNFPHIQPDLEQDFTEHMTDYARRKLEREQEKINRYIGVSKEVDGKFAARIRSSNDVGGKGRELRFLGLFPSAKDAAMAYDDAAQEMFGKNAVLNFPDLQKAKRKKTDRSGDDEEYDGNSTSTMEEVVPIPVKRKARKRSKNEEEDGERVEDRVQKVQRSEKETKLKKAKANPNPADSDSEVEAKPKRRKRKSAKLISPKGSDQDVDKEDAAELSDTTVE